MKFFKCNICGNLVELITNGGGELVCCEEPMEELIPKTKDEGNEKHVPVFEKENGKVTVKVGSVPHPMEEKHYIEWIIVKHGDKIERITLNHNDQPEGIFYNIEDDITEIYEYCNIHGLWKNEIK